MISTILSLATVTLYLLAARGIAYVLLRGPPSSPPRRLQPALIVAGALLHAILLYSNLLTSQGMNFGVFNAASLVGWIVIVILLGASAFRQVYPLMAFLLPMAALAIGLELAFSPQRILPGRTPLGIELHIALSLLAYSVLTIAALQAVLVAVADYQLRHRRPVKVMQALPPLATMETLLFQLIRVGLFLLSLGLVIGFLSVENLFAQHLVHKTVLSLSAWLVFAFLLWGRHYRGWRGRIAVRYTLSGFVLLALGFFGSEIVLQLILHRV
ncbi:MAG: cytochrome C assembly family protein [Chromatiales bacterium]